MYVRIGALALSTKQSSEPTAFSIIQRLKGKKTGHKFLHNYTCLHTLYTLIVSAGFSLGLFLEGVALLYFLAININKVCFEACSLQKTYNVWEALKFSSKTQHFSKQWVETFYLKWVDFLNIRKAINYAPH